MSSLRTQHAGHELASSRSFASWMVPLAVGLFDYFGGKPGSAFFADVLKVDRLFPPDWHPLKRRDHLNRLLLTPLQIDGFLLESISGERVMYKKTRQVVLRVGTLDGGATLSAPGPVIRVDPGTDASAVRPAPPASVDTAELTRLIDERLAHRWVVEGAPAVVTPVAPGAVSRREMDDLQLLVAGHGKMISAVKTNVQRLDRRSKGSTNSIDATLTSMDVTAPEPATILEDDQ